MECHSAPHSSSFIAELIKHRSIDELGIKAKYGRTLAGAHAQKWLGFCQGNTIV